MKNDQHSGFWTESDGRVSNSAADARKETAMDGMTDKQYDDAKATLLRLVLEILRHSKDLSEAIEKVEALLPKK
jgi:hypothetical protein